MRNFFGSPKRGNPEPEPFDTKQHDICAKIDIGAISRADSNEAIYIMFIGDSGREIICLLSPDEVCNLASRLLAIGQAIKAQNDAPMIAN